MTEESLKQKTVKGVGWSAIDNVAHFGVGFIVSIVLARILSPEDYGLIGIVTIFTNVCNTIINSGFNSALIRKKDANEDDFSTAFIVNLVISVLLYAIIYVCSPSIAGFFGREELTSLTRVASLAMIIGALSLVQMTKLTKRIDFKTQTKITIISSILSGIVGIGMAAKGFGVWALVFQTITVQTLKTLLLFFYNRWMPRFHFSMKSFHELFGFGWKIMVSGILESVWKELYQVVVGKFYSSGTLGQYTRAKNFSQLISVNLTNVIQRVTYPVLSNIQDDKQRMTVAYRKVIRITMFVSFACMFMMGAVSEPFIYCLIGPKWQEASTYLPLICFTGALYPLQAINLNMLQVQGRSDLFLYLEIIKKMILLAPLFIGAYIGIMPMLYANIVTSIISYFLNSHYSGKLLGYSSWMQLKDISSSFFNSLATALVVYCLKFIPISFWAILPLQIAIGAIVFIVICRLTKSTDYKELVKIIQPIIKNKLYKS